jgi:catechol 2,3-dioxygenase-like lactoylglutathione lyase family enzyme
MILDHIGMAVSDAARSKVFFTAALAPLRIVPIAEFGDWFGLGRDGRPQFWFGAGDVPQLPMHIAFAAESREQVRQFHAAALQAGGEDNGAPGLRPQYHADYYGAYVIGPDGHNIEAVCHRPEP